MSGSANDNVHAVDFINPSGTSLIDPIILGFKYAADSDGTFNVTYSIPQDGAVFNDEYLVDGVDIADGFFPVTDEVADWFRAAADFVTKTTGLTLQEVPENGPEFGEIRLAGTTLLNPPLGAGVFGDVDKFDRNQTGDIFIDDRAFGDDFIGLDRVVIHELGHALGLGHPGEGFNGAFQLSTDFYGDEYTIMDTNFASVFFPEAVTTDIFPSTFMYLDILALQHLYGVNETATSGDDTYRFDLAENHYLTIFDTGGSDTLRVTGTRGSTEADSVIIDLKSTDTLGGRFINVGTTVTYFDENNAIVGSRKETVYLSPETVIENVVTAAGNDIIVGNDENNLIRAGSGDDIVVGDAGADTIVGGMGHDIIAGGSGDDVIWAGAGDEGNDTVSGDDGNDVIAGGGGNDTIGGGAGSDTIFGGTGNDFVAADGIDNGTPTTSDKTSNTLWAGAGNDTVAGADGSDVLGGGSGDDLLIGAAGDDTVFAGKTGEDTITGGDGDDMLFAGTENDTIDAGAGADTIFGGAGDDVVKGGDGNDSLYGGAGDDTITGGVGADSFFFGGKHGNDIVTDFNASQDVLILTNAQTDFTDLSTVQAASSETTVGSQSGLMIDTGDGSSVFLVGLSLNALSADMLIL